MMKTRSIKKGEKQPLRKLYLAVLRKTEPKKAMMKELWLRKNQAKMKNQETTWNLSQVRFRLREKEELIGLEGPLHK